MASAGLDQSFFEGWRELTAEEQAAASSLDRDDDREDDQPRRFGPPWRRSITMKDVQAIRVRYRQRTASKASPQVRQARGTRRTTRRAAPRPVLAMAPTPEPPGRSSQHSHEGEEPFPSALEPFLAAFVEMIVEDLLAFPPEPKR
jgi:hypothetical protein